MTLNSIDHSIENRNSAVEYNFQKNLIDFALSFRFKMSCYLVNTKLRAMPESVSRNTYIADYRGKYDMFDVNREDRTRHSI
jgi:hypothetical protein